VRELGSDRFATREGAEQRLIRAGSAALPALREAARSEDPEVARRAGALVERLTRPPGPGPVFREAAALLMVRRPKIIAARVAPTGRYEIEVTRREAPGAAILLGCDATGVVVIVRAEVGGELKLEEYRAATPRALAQEQPAEVYALYQSIVTDNGNDTGGFRAWFEHPLSDRDAKK
jgi:hypothetical protein